MQSDTHTFRLNDRVCFSQEYIDMISSTDEDPEHIAASWRAVGTIVDTAPFWGEDSIPRVVVSWDQHANNRFFAGETVVLATFLALI
jgi:hypothetical protein